MTAKAGLFWEAMKQATTTSVNYLHKQAKPMPQLQTSSSISGVNFLRFTHGKSQFQQHLTCQLMHSTAGPLRKSALLTKY